MKLPLRHQRARVRVRVQMQRAQRRMGLARFDLDEFLEMTIDDIHVLTRRIP